MARTLQLSDIFAKSVQILEIGFWQSFKKHTMKGQWHGIKHNKQQGRHSYLCCWDLVQKLNFDHQTGILRQIFRNVYCCKTKISLPKCLLFFILFFQECRQILWRSSLLFWEPLPRRVCSTSKRLTGDVAILLYMSLLSSHFFLLQAWINNYCLVSGRRFSHWPCLPPDLASWKKSVKLLLRWDGSPNQLYHYCLEFVLDYRFHIPAARRRGWRLRTS